MARKFARWAEANLDKEFNARINSTDPEVKAELNDTIKGARLFITSGDNVVLFENVTVVIERVDIAKAKIFARVIKGEDV